MWINAKQVVIETEKASIQGKADVIPGKVYKFVRPFLNFNSAIKVWRKITKRN